MLAKGATERLPEYLLNQWSISRRKHWSQDAEKCKIEEETVLCAGLGED